MRGDKRRNTSRTMGASTECFRAADVGSVIHNVFFLDCGIEWFEGHQLPPDATQSLNLFQYYSLVPGVLFNI